MNTQQLLIGFVVIVVFLFFSNLYRNNTRVLCRFTRRDRSIQKKFAKFKNGERITFDNGWYYIVPKLVRFEASFFNLIPVRVLDFSYISKYPLDPDSGEPVQETPEMRKNLNKREDIEAYEIGGAKALGKTKAGILGGGWMSVILAIGVVACLYLVWQQGHRIDMLGNGQNVMEQMLNQIINKLP